MLHLPALFHAVLELFRQIYRLEKVPSLKDQKVLTSFQASIHLYIVESPSDRLPEESSYARLE